MGDKTINYYDNENNMQTENSLGQVAKRVVAEIYNTSGVPVDLATEDKQDDIIANQTDGSQKTQPVNSSGENIDSHTGADGGEHMGTAIIQTIFDSVNNATTTNLASGATYTGTADETLGINGIQVFHSADQDCTVYLDQSADNTFADSTQTLTSSFICLANEPCARTFTSVSPYFRIRITNTDLSGATTTKIQAGVGMTPIVSVLPAELSRSGNLQVVTSLRGNENYDRHVWVNPTSELATSPVYRMVGTSFDGTTKDTNFWTELVNAGGSVTQGGGEVELKTSATATGWAKYTSVRKARFVAGSAQYFSGGFNFKTAATFGSTRRCGAYTTTDTVNTPVDGFYFELQSSAFSVNSRANAGTVNSVASGSFNGNIGPHFTPKADTYYNLTIEWAPLGTFFYINNELLHKMPGAHLSHYMTLPITMENIYTSGSVDVNFETVGMYIARQGELITNPTYKYLANVTAGVLKYGAGVLHRLTIADSSGNATIYDGLDDTGELIAEVDLSTGTLEFGCPFSNGLYVETSNGSNLTVIYE